VLYFKLFNNNTQYRLIFQSPPYQRLTSPIVHTRVCTLQNLPGSDMWVPGPEQRRDQISHVPNIITVWLLYSYVIHLIHMLMYVLPITYIHLWKRRVIIWKLINLMAHIYSGSHLCPGLGSGVQATTSEDLSLRAPHDTSDIRLLLLWTYHYAPHITL